MFNRVKLKSPRQAHKQESKKKEKKNQEVNVEASYNLPDMRKAIENRKKKKRKRTV